MAAPAAGPGPQPPSAPWPEAWAERLRKKAAKLPPAQVPPDLRREQRAHSLVYDGYARMNARGAGAAAVAQGAVDVLRGSALLRDSYPVKGSILNRGEIPIMRALGAAGIAPGPRGAGAPPLRPAALELDLFKTFEMHLFCANAYFHATDAAAAGGGAPSAPLLQMHLAMATAAAQAEAEFWARPGCAAALAARLAELGAARAKGLGDDLAFLFARAEEDILEALMDAAPGAAARLALARRRAPLLERVIAARPAALVDPYRLAQLLITAPGAVPGNAAARAAAVAAAALRRAEADGAQYSICTLNLVLADALQAGAAGRAWAAADVRPRLAAARAAHGAMRSWAPASLVASLGEELRAKEAELARLPARAAGLPLKDLRFVDDGRLTRVCGRCGKAGVELLNKECQRAHWPAHKAACKAAASAGAGARAGQ